MEKLPVVMIREDLDGFPNMLLPDGYVLRKFVRGEERIWAQIETEAGLFPHLEGALQQFHSEFAPHLDEMERRCFFIETVDGEAIGTATAWFDPQFRDGQYGKIHWVAIRPPYQGRKLAKPLISALMNWFGNAAYGKVFLMSETTSYKAINLYLDYGFHPYKMYPSCDAAWQLLSSVLNRSMP